MGEYVYYHFFDRELRQSVNAVISDIEICKIISVSLLMSDGIFYFPISHFYESYSEFPKSFKYINQLELLNIVYLLSGHDSVEKFIFSRQEMYKHDKARYPMYFDNKTSNWPSNLIILENSTTEILRNNFINEKINIKEFDDHKIYIINRKIKKIVENDREKAITYSLFKRKISHMFFKKTITNVISDQLKMKISKHYTQRYLDIFSGTIITGIDSIRQYDYLAKDKYSTNYSLYINILKTIGIDIDELSFFEFILSLRKDKELFNIIRNQLSCFIQSLSNLLKNKKIKPIDIYNEFLYSNKTYQKINDISSFIRNLSLYLDDIYNNHKSMYLEMEKINSNKKSLVIVVVTKIEMEALFNAIRNYCPRQLLLEKITGDLLYRELFGCRLPVYIVQSEMGISGTGSIISTINKIHTYLKPEKIIMVGIAFGINEENQKIGDVLVSKQVWSYEPSKKAETEIISRGDKIPASNFLLQLFRSTELTHNVDVHFGLIASGEKLINSKEFIAELKLKEKELIGGDMEAAGLASVCTEKKIEWIIIKAICDWGHDKNSHYQVKAADNACDFLMKGLVKIIC
jgi:nucleoside phosphorylase